MRAETWMDHDPVRRKSPLELAKIDVEHWERRLRTAIADVTMCQQELDEAREELSNLQSV